MQNLNFSGQFANSKSFVDVVVHLFKFAEDDKMIIYSPAFDLSGYGANEEEAKKSFQNSLCEVIDYTMNKKTFAKELKRLGWNVSGSNVKKKKFKTHLNVAKEEFLKILYSKL